MIKIVFLLFFFNNCSLHAQSNLVINGGFDEINHFIDDTDSVFLYRNWETIHFFKNRTRLGMPDYQKYWTDHRGGMAQKHIKIWDDFFKPYQGNGFYYIMISYLRNLYQTSLIEPMVRGEQYKVSFKYRVGYLQYSKSETIKRVNNGKIGLIFTSKNIYSDSLIRKNINNIHANINPDLVLQIAPEADIDTWQDYSIILSMEKDANFIILGNFNKLLEADEVPPSLVKGITVFIDNLEIVKTYSLETSYMEINTLDDSLVLNYLHPGTANYSDSIFDLLNTIVYKGGDVNEGESYKYLAEEAVLNSDYLKAFDYYPYYFKLASPDFMNYTNCRKTAELAGLPDSVLNDIRTIWNNSKTKRDPTLGQKLDSLCILDQKVRLESNYSLSIKQQDSLNFISIKKILESDTLSYSKLGHNTFQNIGILLFHLSRYEDFLALIPSLNISLQTGGITPRFYAMLIDEFYKIHISGNWSDSYYHTDAYQSNGEVYIIKDYTDEELELINSRRNFIGLEDIHLQHQLQMYNICNGYNDFEFYQLFIDPSLSSLTANNTCNCEVVLQKCLPE